MKELNRAAWRVAICYAALSLVILLGTTMILLHTLQKSTEIRLPAETEAIYVYLPREEESESESTIQTEAVGYLVKEYQGQIGVFSTDGRLLEIWDTYVKTLPETDRSLLEEGISVKTREELNSLLEDYSH